MPVDVYFAPTSGPCRAVLMAAKELGVDINLKVVNTKAGEQKKPEFLKMNPLHRVPTIDDNGFYLSESRAIMMYFANKYAPDSSLYPKDPQKRALVDQLLYLDIECLYNYQADFFNPQIFKNEQPDPVKEEKYKASLTVLNSFLEKTAYIVGSERTLADISILAGMAIVELTNYDISAYPKITAWLAKMKSEVPCYAEINVKPLEGLKEKWQSRSK